MEGIDPQPKEEQLQKGQGERSLPRDKIERGREFTGFGS
jgi:hypothetical protein